MLDTYILVVFPMREDEIPVWRFNKLIEFDTLLELFFTVRVICPLFVRETN
jgi:hypothetical protein